MVAEGARPIRSAAMPNPIRPDHREQPGEPEDPRDEQPGEAVVHREGHLVRDDREDRQRRAEVREEERPERARPQRVADLRAPGEAPARSCRRAGAGAAGPVVHAQPDEGQEHGERAQAQGEIGGAPAVSGDQPLGERPHRQHAGAHARERHAHRAAAPLGEPPRDQRARRHPAHRARPGRGQHADDQVERPQRVDPARQRASQPEQARPAEHHPARPQAVHQRPHHGREHALRDRRDRERRRGGAARPAELLQQRHEEDREREVEAGGDREGDPDRADD